RPPIAPKWERFPGLVQRVFTYVLRRAVFQVLDNRDKRKDRERDRREKAAERARAARQALTAEGGEAGMPAAGG
ncbi:MAG: hypothetical protein IH609_17235, partial [Dehalococcoidia bacterium]|nr:hypothetical protein [Dehalococcoidia bacterium]